MLFTDTVLWCRLDNDNVISVANIGLKVLISSNDTDASSVDWPTTRHQ